MAYFSWEKSLASALLWGVGASLLQGCLLVAVLVYQRLSFIASAELLMKDPGKSQYVRDLQMTLGPEGVRITSPVSTTDYRWGAIKEVAGTDDHAFFYLNHSDALILPRRAFVDEREFREFLERARGFQAQASGS